MNAMDFDALVYKNQDFNTLDNLSQSGVVNEMSQQTLGAIKTMQTPTAQGFVPTHVTLPVFQQQASAGRKGKQSQQTASQNDIQIYVSLNGKQKGPFTLEQLKGLVIAEVIDEKTLVWHKGLQNWTDLKTCLTNL